MVPVGQARAVKILANVLQSRGLQPMRRGEVALASGGTVDVDVGARGKKLGIAYLTRQEAEALLPNLPGGLPEDGGALKVVLGVGADADSRILLLAASNYMADDQIGADRNDTTITAESKLARDARDFLAKASEARWP